MVEDKTHASKNETELLLEIRLLLFFYKNKSQIDKSPIISTAKIK